MKFYLHFKFNNLLYASRKFIEKKSSSVFCYYLFQSVFK